MITTVTLNAAVDKTYRVETMQPNTVMRVRECVATAGGKGLNVAKVAAALGGRVNATGFLGGYTGGYLRSLLQGSGVEDAFMEVPGETRTCINVMDDAGASTEYLEPGLHLQAQDVDAFLPHFEAAISESAVVTLSGSMPGGCPQGYYQTLVKLARAAGRQVVLDSSGEALRLGLEALPTIIKPNTDELAALLGAPPTPEAALAEALRLHRKGIPYVVLSQGAKGAAMVCGAGVFTAKAPGINAVNPVGCGDAMVAALAVALERGLPPAEMLAFAVEVSAASAMHPQTGGLSAQQHAALQGTVVVKQEEASG